MSRHPEDDPGALTAMQAGLQHQRALFDFDPTETGSRRILGGDPYDLSEADIEAVRSLGTADTVLTIYARAGQAQDMADLLAVRSDLISVAAAYAADYREEHGAPIDFRLYPLTDEERSNIEAHRARQSRRPGDPRD